MSQKKKTRQGFATLRRLMKKPAFIISGALAISCLVAAPMVSADQYDQQIQQLQSQNSQDQSSVNSLQAQAASYQDAINQLQGQISGLQAAIADNQAKQTQLEQQIQADQGELDHQKQVLSADIKAMYVDGSMSTIEELATSKNLSDFVDAETYRNAVQGEVQKTLDQISKLENQLQDQKNQVDQVLKVQQQQNSQLASDEQQQQQLLSYNQSQQDQYNQQIQANQSQIAKLVAEQIAANRKLVGSGSIDYSGTCGGGYPAQATGGTPGPWGCDYVHSSDYVPGCTYEDSWGMCNRECVSYTAWMVYKNDGINVTGFGNANQWPSKAASDNIPMGSTPRPGSVAIYMGGSLDPYGHAMWVKNVNSDGTITVDQYNLYYDGNFYETTISASGLTYIYFGQ